MVCQELLTTRQMEEARHSPIFCDPMGDWYRNPFWWISTSPGSRFPSNAGRTNTSGNFVGRRPLTSTSVSCSMTSAISFFCCSRLFTSFLRSVICFEIASKRLPSVDRYVIERINVASGSSKGWQQWISHRSGLGTMILTVSSFRPASCPGVWKFTRRSVNSASSFLLTFLIVLMWKGTA